MEYCCANAQIRLSGVSLSSDFHPASRYIRPEDNFKTQSTITQVRYSALATLQLSNRFDSTSGQIRKWTGSIASSVISEPEIGPQQVRAVDQ